MAVSYVYKKIHFILAKKIATTTTTTKKNRKTFFWSFFLPLSCCVTIETTALYILIYFPTSLLLFSNIRLLQEILTKEKYKGNIQKTLNSKIS